MAYPPIPRAVRQRLRAEHGIGPICISLFQAAGVTDPDIMIRLEASLVYGGDAVHFHAAGITDLDVMIHLKASGVYGRDAVHFHAAGITDPDIMIQLTTSGVNSYNAVDFHEVGVTDPDVMKQLVASGIYGRNAKDFHAAGITDPDSMMHLTTSNVSGYDALLLHNAGLRTVQEMAGFSVASKLNGVTPRRLNNVYARLDGLGELGARIRSVHIAPAATEALLGRTTSIAPLLEQLTNSQLETAVCLAEDRPSVSASDMRGYIKLAQ